jgi:EAL domain-containing protein (putative c-di-GMP-specific phosphodiesterase class I)/DNA-binding NarL/FixJ family response regulator
MKDRDLLAEFADRTVLVIDDQVANVDLLEALLRKAGIAHVVSEVDPRVAVATLASVNPDLVLLDLHMPQMSGLEVLDRLVAFAAGSYLPVLLLTADTSREALQAALSRGADDFVTKPFFTTEVLLRVQNLLRTRSLYSALRHEHGTLEGELRGLRAGADHEAEHRENTRQRIQDVIDHDDLRIAVQPIIDLDDGDVVGYEGLARFPEDSNRHTEEWFQEADSVGLGPDLERHALRSALQLLDVLPRESFLAVNASPSVITDGQLEDVLEPSMCPGLVLELTERVPVEDYPTIHRLLEPMRKEGLRLAVDDTGAGYAGLRHLLGLTPDIIKLDISLIHHIDSDPAKRALTAALVAFAREVGSGLIAEGIETAEELETLRSLGIEWGQGFLLARPAPPSSFINSNGASTNDANGHEARRNL